ncbi:lysophospholipid acyltransferase family protein [Francisella frigiditurris]|uniref:Bacterial lipid A biosynthesis acyltransferase family protein n=1 Tax=Francisella frigiditurris TaxID=1542390 RepID=A0A1J0KUJ8_9GAMM|nr:lysophospholipid acyltransferase family protein [Francisella frigiditurris]APC97445.1 bacterial lipid A biosynthesis acyltransferase family protein [Francisella frigiditurris]
MKRKYLKLKYLPVWLLIGFGKAFTRLPYKVQMRAAIVMGKALKPFLKKRREITITNLKIAFPEKNEKELGELVSKSFDSAYMAAAESLIAWFMPDKNFKKIKFEIENKEVFDKIHNDPDKALLFLGFHFHSLEIVGRYIGSQYKPFTLVYQKHSNELMEEVVTSSRKRSVTECYERKNLLPIIRSLRKKITLWYAPDQDFGQEHSVFVPLFDKECSTLVVTPWLVKKTGATVVPVYYTRNDDLSGYKVNISDPIEDFPEDEVKGARFTNEILENFIRKAPEQYLWQHRRYKTRPDGEPKIY